MPPPVLRYAITDRHLLRAHERNPATATTLTPADLLDLLAQIHQLRTAKIDFLQIREKDLSPMDLRTLAQKLRKSISPDTLPRLLLNLGHPAQHAATLATAVALHLDGLHLPTDTPPAFPAEIRRTFLHAGLAPPVLSISTHTLAGIPAAASTADLILFGPVFGKTVFPSGNPHAGREVTPALGIDTLAAAVQLAHPTPVLALGGITPVNTPACLAAGAAGVAGIRLFL